jgi:hypothetical protein
MLLTSKDGIACDLCGREYKRKFSYYSAEFTKISADAEKKVTGPTEVDKKHLNLDICEICYNSLAQKVVEIAKAKGLA